MDRIDTMLEEFFAPEAPPRLSARLLGALRTKRADLDALAEKFRIEATERGVFRLQLGRGSHGASARARAHAERAREELREYFAGRRTFFTVAVDLAGVAKFQARVLAEARRIPFGAVDSYAALARRVGHPRAARAVGNALGANPVPLIVPCHRIIRGDGTWGHYAFGGAMKTQLLQLERTTPVLTGCTSTRIVCRRGCVHEQRVAEANRIVFASVRDAESVGYRPCRVCRPPRAA
ncbi:MAG: cysteine methyltransferase [Candidatus Rokuibacteriota bacterium]|nr:MAG: cysteine methyltransferase [Candidatus Rokubacteria bacterium]PYN76393.1 MAG: cysteine methyltransferase [Candidatus Rokubacteria bacterium]